MTTLNETVQEYVFGISALNNRISELKKQSNKQSGDLKLIQRIYDLEVARGEMIRSLHSLREYLESIRMDML